MLNEETIDFLVNVSLFEKLSDEELEVISEDIVLEYYPKGVKLQNPVTDTHSIHDWLYKNDADFARHHKGMTTRKALFSMARRYGLAMVKAHNAFHDAYLTAQLFQRFLHFLPPCGVHSVRDLVSVGKI